MKDNINYPAHYLRGKIEVHDFIADQGCDWDAGNVLKYVCRYRDKGGLEDLLKAQWYLNSLIRRYKNECDRALLADGPICPAPQEDREVRDTDSSGGGASTQLPLPF